MPTTEPMSRRAEFAAVRDRPAVDGLITDCAVAVDDGDREAHRRLFAPRGRADHRSAGGMEGEAGAVAA
ncbi:nuclear transport factor 2 family protein [Streptomyces sp. NPDC003877]